MKRLLVTLIVLGSAATAAAQPRRMSLEEQPEAAEPPTVYLYSFGLGDVIFEKFGHSALCLDYGAQFGRPFDVCFNYGVTDFHDPTGLVWGFIRSKAKFWVEPVPEPEIMRFYTQFEDRSVWRQKLPLAPEEARKVEAHLWNDLKPENRYYFYDHFYDNCTTRLRDILDEATGGRLRGDTDKHLHPLTFREFGARGLAQFTPLITVSDFITGRPLDHRPTMWEAMFHPDELRLAVEQNLHAPTEVLYVRRGPPFPERPDWHRGLVIVLGLLVCVPFVLVRWLGKRERLAMTVAMLPSIVFGIVVWAIFAVVTIYWIRWNEAMLIFVPTDVAVPFLAPGRRRRYAQVRVAMIVLATLLRGVGIFHQPLWVPALVAFVPLAMIAFDLPPRRRGSSAEISASSRAVG